MGIPSLMNPQKFQASCHAQKNDSAINVIDVAFVICNIKNINNNRRIVNFIIDHSLNLDLHII